MRSALLLLLFYPAHVAQWTGRLQHTFTAKHQPAVRCQYKHKDAVFWKTYPGKTCPVTYRLLTQ